MSEQRLIDGNELYGIESLLNTDIIRNSKEASWLMSQVLYDIQSMPTIDPETLPIVQDLRSRNKRLKAVVKVQLEQIREKTAEIDELCEKVADLDEKLHRVTAERDAAYEDFKMLETDSLCSVCMNMNAPDIFCDDCKGYPHIATDMFRWRGAQKEK